MCFELVWWKSFAAPDTGFRFRRGAWPGIGKPLSNLCLQLSAGVTLEENARMWQPRIRSMCQVAAGLTSAPGACSLHAFP